MPLGFSVTPCLRGENPALFHDDRRLPGKLKPLAAAHVLAGHHVIFPDHVGAELRESGTIAFVGASGKLALLGSDHPGHLVVSRLMAMRTIQ